MVFSLVEKKKLQVNTEVKQQLSQFELIYVYGI